MLKFSTRSIFAVVAIVAVACLAYTQLVLPAREAARGMSCRNNVKQIGLALLNYESACRSLPIAAETDSEGKLWRSWRSQIYPRFMVASSMFYDVNASWDAPTNTRLLNGTPVSMGEKGGGTFMMSHDRYPSLFTCPSCQSTGINYVVVSGELTAFPKLRGVKLSEIKDGLENTILVVESTSCTPDWTEPRDLEFDTMSFVVNSKNGPSISSLHPLGPLVVFADGEAYHVTKNVKAAELRAMLTIAGNENVVRQELISRGVLIGY